MKLITKCSNVKKFKNPYIGLRKEDFVELVGSEKELLTAEIELADSKGESLAYFRIDGDFFYDDIYYSADILVPKTHWLSSHDVNKKNSGLLLFTTYLTVSI